MQNEIMKSRDNYINTKDRKQKNKQNDHTNQGGYNIGREIENVYNNEKM